MFDFDENGSTSSENNPGDITGGEETGDAPAVGTLYKGCYVLKSETSGNNTIVTLMAPGSKNALEFTKGDQASMLEAVNKGIAELAVSNIEGWRLPSLAEMQFINENLETINSNLTNLGEGMILKNSGGSLYSYYIKTADGKISTYNLTRGDTTDNPGSGLKSLVLRAFATLTFTK